MTTTRSRVMRRLRVGLAVVLGATVLTGCDFDVYKLPLPGGTDVGDDPMTITVYFADVLDLVPKSTVKVNDVNVGQVVDVSLDGYTAEVKIELQNDVDLPEDTVATIRQTSLLGEKFVSLEAPEGGGSGELTDGEVIPIERTGRNPEVEEVLGALSMVLNGGGIAKAKIISQEINAALEGREEAAKSVLSQVAEFMGQLDANRDDIVNSIDALNKLALAVREQQPSIDAALEELPSALRSLDSQRDDLVKMLQALERLSDTGVDVIRRSKDQTIYTLRQLQPVLTQLGNAGDALVQSLSILPTYPFPDEVVGRDPQVARNLHMGDYTNLSIQLDLDLANLPEIPGIPCDPLSAIPPNTPLGEIDLVGLCQDAQDAIAKCVNNPSPRNCRGLPAGIIKSVCNNLPLPIPVLCGAGTGTGNNDNGGLDLPGLDLPGLDLPGGLGGLLNRPGTGQGTGASDGPTLEELMTVYDPALVVLLGGAAA